MTDRLPAVGYIFHKSVPCAKMRHPPLHYAYEKVSPHPGYPYPYGYEKASTHPGHSG
jgi:hypothetical protein